MRICSSVIFFLRCAGLFGDSELTLKIPVPRVEMLKVHPPHRSQTFSWQKIMCPYRTTPGGRLHRAQGHARHRKQTGWSPRAARMRLWSLRCRKPRCDKTVQITEDSSSTERRRLTTSKFSGVEFCAPHRVRRDSLCDVFLWLQSPATWLNTGCGPGRSEAPTAFT